MRKECGASLIKLARMTTPASGSFGGACDKTACEGSLVCNSSRTCTCPIYTLDTKADKRSCDKDNSQLCVGAATSDNETFYYLDHYQWGPTPPKGTPKTATSADTCAAACFADKFDAASFVGGTNSCTCFSLSDVDSQCLTLAPVTKDAYQKTTLLSKEWLPSKTQGAICNERPS